MALPEDEAKQTIEEETVPAAEKAPAEAEVVAEEADAPEKTASDMDELVDEALETALAEVDRYKDLALRAEAEMQNMQRRTARDVENAHKYGLEKFVQSLMPVVDSLDKAIEATEQAPEGDAIAEGVRLCHKLMIDTLSKEGVTILDPVGEPFDPNEHQAMSMVENPDMEPNSVFVVVQKGCKLNDRLVRPAMVMVSKAPAEPAEENDE